MFSDAHSWSMGLRHKVNMQALDLVFLGLLGIIAAIDYKKFYVPFWGLMAIMALCVIKQPLTLTTDMCRGLLLMLVSLFLGDYILERETLGGGDLWLGTAMSAFMGIDKFIIAYTVAALLGMVAMMTVHRKFQMFDMAYAPYLAAGAFVAMVIK